MQPLIEEIEYHTETAFLKLTAAIQFEIDAGNLSKYIDPSWPEKSKYEWSGDYISITKRKMYRFDGNHYLSTSGEAKFEGKWTIIRSEQTIENTSFYLSKFKIRAQAPGIYSNIEFEVQYTKTTQPNIEFDWIDVLSNGKEHSRMIKSSVEYGIVSAFEDINPVIGNYKIKILLVRYHPIDSSFSLLQYSANRNLKRALFVEQEDQDPKIEKGQLTRIFRPNFTIGRWNDA